MVRLHERKCLFCRVLFRCDPRNARHQKYCSQPPCRKASQAASRRAWLTQAANQDYFRGPENVARVQAWRAAHPGYWRRSRGPRATEPQAPLALQDLCPTQGLDIPEDFSPVPQPALQDLWRSQPPVLIGFIAQFTGSTLQEDIAKSTQRLLELGQDVLAGRSAVYDHQTGAMPRAAPSDPGPV